MHWGNYWQGGPKYPPGTKRYCSKCGVELVEGETMVRRKHDGKIVARCRDCEIERSREYYRANHDEILRKMREDPKRREREKRASKEKNRRYWERHHDDPEWRKRKNEQSRRSKQRRRERMGEEEYKAHMRVQQRERRARRRAEREGQAMEGYQREKQAFVTDFLGPTVAAATGGDVRRLEYAAGDGQGYVHVVFGNGRRKLCRVTGDSLTALCVDVLAALG